QRSSWSQMENAITRGSLTKFQTVFLTLRSALWNCITQWIHCTTGSCFKGSVTRMALLGAKRTLRKEAYWKILGHWICAIGGDDGTCPFLGIFDPWSM
ncbi:hypothetical protein STEG23_012285, partial [Scotinomys teguina]